MVSPGSWRPPFLFSMLWANFRRSGIFSSSDDVCDVSIRVNYILLTVTDIFGKGKWAKIERNDGKLLRVWTSPIVEENTRDNSELVVQDTRAVGASLISSLEIARYGFRWYFPMFANIWIYWKVELLQHVNMKHNNKFYWYVKSFHLTIYWQFVVLYFNLTIFHNL